MSIFLKLLILFGVSILSAKEIKYYKECNQELQKSDFNVTLVKELCRYPAIEIEKLKDYENASWFYLISGDYKYNIDKLSHLIKTSDNTSNIAHSYMLDGNFSEAKRYYSLSIKDRIESIIKRDPLKNDFRILKRLYPDKVSNIEKAQKISTTLIEREKEKFYKKYLIYTCFYYMGYKKAKDLIPPYLDTKEKIYNSCLEALKSKNLIVRLVIYAILDQKPSRRVVDTANALFNKELAGVDKDKIAYRIQKTNFEIKSYFLSIDRLIYKGDSKNIKSIIDYVTYNYIFNHNLEYLKCINDYKKGVKNNRLCNDIAIRELKANNDPLAFWMFYFANNESDFRQRVVISYRDKNDFINFIDFASNRFNIDRKDLIRVLYETEPIKNRAIFHLLKSMVRLDREKIVSDLDRVLLKDYKKVIKKLSFIFDKKNIDKIREITAPEREIVELIYKLQDIILPLKEEMELYSKYLNSRDCNKSIEYLEKMLILEKQTDYTNLNRRSKIEAHILQEYQKCSK